MVHGDNQIRGDEGPMPVTGILGLPMQMGVFLNGGIMEIIVRAPKGS